MTRKIFQKYKDGILGPANAVYNGYYDDQYFYMQFSEQFWFERELQCLNLLVDKPYTPQIVHIDLTQKEITFEWGESLNHALEHGTAPKDYKEQVKEILNDLVNSGVYKINTYPWTFYIVDDKIKVMDTYACTLEKEEIPYSLVENIINDSNRFIFKDNLLDVKATYQKTLEYEKEFWPEEFLNG